MANSTATSCLQFDSETLWQRIEAAAPLDALPADAVPPYFDDDDSERRFSQSGRRRTFIALYAWAVPTREAIEAIAGFVRGDQVLEVCAGNGLWARLLTDRGVHVIATDACAPPSTPYAPVAVIDAEAAVRAHPECRSLLFVWPPFRQDYAFRALTAFEGDKLVYAGDRRFTGDRQLQDLLDKAWTLSREIQIPAWPGLDDQVYLYGRR
jgi:hypothetical protein